VAPLRIALEITTAIPAQAGAALSTLTITAEGVGAPAWPGSRLLCKLGNNLCRCTHSGNIIAISFQFAIPVGNIKAEVGYQQPGQENKYGLLATSPICVLRAVVSSPAGVTTHPVQSIFTWHNYGSVLPATVTPARGIVTATVGAIPTLQPS
jgi:hypothetical protein